jgi:hypothetical protein
MSVTSAGDEQSFIRTVQLVGFSVSLAWICIIVSMMAEIVPQQRNMNRRWAAPPDACLSYQIVFCFYSYLKSDDRYHLSALGNAKGESYIDDEA